MAPSMSSRNGVLVRYGGAAQRLVGAAELDCRSGAGRARRPARVAGPIAIVMLGFTSSLVQGAPLGTVLGAMLDRRATLAGHRTRRTWLDALLDQ
jgi:hypothetical protein